MQQAYSVLRVIAEAQTIRLILTQHPSDQLLAELAMACRSLQRESSSGLKAVILDFERPAHSSTAPFADGASGNVGSAALEEAVKAIQDIAQPLIAVVRASPSPATALLIEAADLVLISSSASLTFTLSKTGRETLRGDQAVHQGVATWSAPEQGLDHELERILDMLRAKSAVALRHTKASVRVASTKQQHAAGNTPAARLAALSRVNAYYLAEVARTADAAEGLAAFLEKRKPHWTNH